MTNELRTSILRPHRVYSLEDVSNQPCPVPPTKGVYGWYFREIPPEVPVSNCGHHKGLALLYVGRAPDSEKSSQSLRTRIKNHYAPRRASTLRRSLGVLLESSLKLELRRLGGRGRKFDYGDTEESLSAWMADNAFVAWVEHPRPWEIEPGLIAALDLPLNMKGNEGHAFYPRLKELRAHARYRAHGDI